jgi:tetratricopeptide (TPR) repeat protein
MARLVALVFVCFATEARADVAQEDMAKAATALFEQGRQLLESGQADAACDKFEASLRLDPQIGTKLNVAACREDKGRFLDAYKMFEDAGEEAVRTNKQGRDTFARQRMEKLHAKLVRVSLRISPTPGSSVQLATKGETRTLTPAQLAKSIVIEPGSFSITVSAPEYESFRVERTGEAGAEVVIDVPALEPATGSVGVNKPGVDHLPDIDEPNPAPAIVLGCGGAVGLIGSVALGLAAKSSYDKAVLNNDAHAVHEAQHEADIATAFAVVGLAAITVGVVLYVHNRRHATAAAIAPTATAHSIGLGVVGSF